MSDNELEDYKNLITHPGWLRLVNAEREYWNEHLGDHLARCADDRDEATALNKLRQVIAAKQAVERFIAKPAERLRILENPQSAPPVTQTRMYRGGM